MRRASLILAVAVAAAVWFPVSAQASFGFLPGSEGFDVAVQDEGGVGVKIQAGSHPYEISTSVNVTEGDLRNLDFEEPAGLIENPSTVMRCSQARFHEARTSPYEESRSGENCPPLSQIGTIEIRSSAEGNTSRSFGLFNLEPPPGFPAQIGASPYGVPLVLTPRLRDIAGEYGSTLHLRNVSQRFSLQGLTLHLWGSPWGLSHNGERGNCLNEAEPSFPRAKCPITPPSPPHTPFAYLTLPASCEAPLTFGVQASSWQGPEIIESIVPSRDEEGNPAALTGCPSLRFEPLTSGQPTNFRASSATGYDFTLTPKEEALTNSKNNVPSQPRKVVVALPEGMTINPSVAAGLGVCPPSGYAAETVTSPPGAACPENSKIGKFTVQSPLFEETIEGGIYLAQPDLASTPTPGAENPFDSLLAVYLVAKTPNRGVIVKVAGQLVADPTSGSLTALFDRLPQLPYSHLQIHFREGQRAPLITPSACGSFTSRIDLSPWNDPNAHAVTSSAFAIEQGIGPGGACPVGTPPFTPQANGGTLNSNSGTYTPFYLHLTRTDAEQEITSYSASLPKGLTGRLAGIPFCPDAAIEAAKSKTGTAEEEHPSCPAASLVGHTTAGYGVGPVLAYAPGKMYLAGPYHGSALSLVAIDSAKVGPFDLGTIVIRSAFTVDQKTAALTLDSATSDPIPHIIDGIPLHLRDIRIYIDRPNFTHTPTSCDSALFTSTLGGSGARFGDPSDNTTATIANRFQPFNCSARAFEPKLTLRLRGKSNRGAHPALRAVLKARPQDADLKRIVVAMPHTEFLAQDHIKDICTQVQFAAGRCPADSAYGRATAYTPLLDEPLHGPVYLRSSPNQLPDLVADLHSGAIRIVLDGRIDSVGAGQLRASFEGLPDAPLDRFVLNMAGGARGLLVNSANLCSATSPAVGRMVGQNNKGYALEAPLEANCSKKKKGRKGR